MNGWQTLTEQGLSGSQEEVESSQYQFSEAEIKQSIRLARASAPNAEMVLVGGAGVRFLNIIEELEQEFGVPVLSSDVALHWAPARALKMKLTTKRIAT